MERVLAVLERLTLAQERTAATLEHLSLGWAGADSERAVAGRNGRETQKERAVRLLVQTGTGNITAVAKAVGVTPRTLYRWPETRKVMDRLRSIEVWEVRNPRAARPDEI